MVLVQKIFLSQVVEQLARVRYLVAATIRQNNFKERLSWSMSATIDLITSNFLPRFLLFAFIPARF